ncbi:MAG: aminotransferase class V-fold PLP-dependent enzyme, partial [Acidobacteriota bacterium]
MTPVLRPFLYLDHNATTPLAAEARQAMMPHLDGQFGNPSSLHRHGQRARVAVEEAREQVAALLGSDPNQVVFVSGGTEADNLALRGVMGVRAARESRRHLLVSAVEHPAVLDTAQALAAQGFELELIPTDADGRVDPREVERRLRPDTALVSVMAANHEVGTLQPVRSIARLLHGRGIVFHVDAVQA